MTIIKAAASQSNWQEFAGVAEHNEVAGTDLYMYRLTHKPSRNIQFKLGCQTGPNGGKNECITVHLYTASNYM